MGAEATGADLLKRFEDMTALGIELNTAVTAWDDVTDKLFANPLLQEELRITKDQLQQASRILRKVQDAVLKRQGELKTCLSPTIGRPEPDSSKMTLMWEEAEAAVAHLPRVFESVLLPGKRDNNDEMTSPLAD